MKDTKKKAKKKLHPWRAFQPGMFSGDKNNPIQSTPYAPGSMKKNRTR